MNVLAELRDRFAAALRKIGVDEGASGQLVELVLPSQDAKFGDYQSNLAMPLGKQLGKPPREVAQQLVANIDLADMCEPPAVAGPGFVNLRLKDSWLREHLSA